MAYLIKLYKEKIIWDIFKKYNLKTIMEVPRVNKIVISMGCGNLFFDKKKTKEVIKDITNISGQYPICIKSKKSISTFKLRKGSYIGIKVTLRKFLMYNFLDKLINITIPKIKNFKGFSVKSFDCFGNFNFGFKDYSVFPEISNFFFDFIRGLNININISSKNIEKSIYLLKLFKFPFSF